MINENAILEINKKNLILNYKLFLKIANQSIVAATIKADAYGLGDNEVLKILYKEGCNHFFLATTEEGIRIRKINKKAKIYILNGLEGNTLNLYDKYNLIPILNSKKEIDTLIRGKLINKKIKFGIHVETGLNRLGVHIKDLNKKFFQRIDLEILLSHLASPDESQNKYNQMQNQNIGMNILNLLERTSHYNYQNTNSLQSIINSTLNDKSLYKKVLSDKGKSSLTKVIYLNNPEQFPNDKCPITYIQFEDNQEITQLPCKHCFDTEAINKWLKEEKAECPVCRFKLHAKEEKITSENQLQTQTNTNVADPHPPISETRATFFNSLSRLPIHPFGPRNQTTNIPIPGQLSFHRIANIFNQQDDNADLQQALYNSIQNNNDNDPSTIDE